MPPDWILCFRHGEKRSDENGDELPGLSSAGNERRRLLADALDAEGSLLPDGAPAPSQIFVPAFDGVERRRAFETVELLAARLNVIPVQLERDEVGGLADRVLASSERVVVICWEHDALAAWLQRFAGKVVVTPTDARLPVSWNNGRYDLLWQLHRARSAGNDAYDFSQRSQDLPVEEVYDSDGRRVGYIDRHAQTFVPETA